ncbi:uncharacterized protein L203_100373 [Cryptococcus depauperatus CBS 7841]|uniref:Uncharacterized protein n=1 Tax=Cryptococcus depauperatus CBS 7841 TaxID=1295531 RepID=A0AAJ8LXP1_9TREE
MTSLDPSHLPFSNQAQAVYHPSNRPTSSAFPDNLPTPSRHNREKTKEEARRRVRGHMIPLPDLRFEQSYLLSIRPFLKPRPQSKSSIASKGEKLEQQKQTAGTALVQSADQDEVFIWGSDVDVDWANIAWVTFRDQFFAPLIQGAVWGWATIFLSATGVALRTSLYPASHKRQGRIVGGPGGSVERAGGGEAVGGPWWKSWVKSLFGGVETNTVI